MPKYTFAERAILAKLCPDSAAYYDRAQRVFAEGFQREYNEYIGIFQNELDEEDANATIDAMEMFWDMQIAYDAMDDKSGIDPDEIGFPGFDGNYETARLIYARFMRDDEKKFDTLRLNHFNDLNSHHPTTEIYERMFPVWKAARRAATKPDVRQLNKGEILVEMKRPSDR